MDDAREYSRIWGYPHQYGQLYVIPRKGAHGVGFSLYVLETDKPVVDGNLGNCVEVYGIISQDPEITYGWVHYGPWQEDFKLLVEKQRNIFRNKEQQDKRDAQNRLNNRLNKEKERIKKILATYKVYCKEDMEEI